MRTQTRGDFRHSESSMVDSEWGMRKRVTILIKKNTHLTLPILYPNPIRLALRDDSNVTSNTMLILLAGISMAATIGERVPCTANESPTIL
jgi:hypothetical protein